jgi:serine/threonine protein kinase
VLLDKNYNLKIADFGFSIPLTGRDGSSRLQSNLGTPGYQAPEIID